MINILFEDEYIIVVDKPAGMLVIPNSKNEDYTLTKKINEILNKRGSTAKAHPCHRLDKETSGLIIFAKGKKSQRTIMSLFHDNKIKKRYFALISGIPNKKEGIINFKVEGKESLTKYKIIEERKCYSIVEIELLTGRTNQIRIHFKMIGHPLLGESKYAFRKDFDIKFKRVALHSKEIELIHPITNKTMVFESHIPEDLKNFIKKN